jgi:hypothetical protein
VKKALKAGVKVMLFYGDTDMRCNLLLGAKFTASIGHEVIGKELTELGNPTD